MHWLVVVPKALTLADRNALFSQLAVIVNENDLPVDLETGVAVEVEGPADLAECCKPFKEVLGVYPSSEMTLL